MLTILLCRILLRHGISSQSEDSDLFIFGKSSLNHAFKYSFCDTVLVFFFVNSSYAYVESPSLPLIIFSLVLSFYSFLFCCPYPYLSFSAIFIVSCAAFDFVFILCEFKIFYFTSFLSSVAYISSSNVLPCAWTYFKKTIILFLCSHFIKAIASFFLIHRKVIIIFTCVARIFIFEISIFYLPFNFLVSFTFFSCSILVWFLVVFYAGSYWVAQLWISWGFSTRAICMKFT